MNRYKETAEDLYYGDSLNPTNLEEALRATALAAQIRVLREVLDRFTRVDASTADVVTEIRRRLEFGEDI